MPSIENWLAELGLEKYAPIFKGAEIDFETLPDLLEEDLKEMDLPLGPRRKIWRAIVRLADARMQHSANQTAAPAVQGGVHSVRVEHAERRHMTVMFVDLVGSTEMTIRLDPEDMRQIITAYQNAVTSIVGGFDGFIATLMGDGVLCYFGWPHANEDDTERAVRAGLSIIEAIRKISTPDSTVLSTRIGVASGVVVVGDLIGFGGRQEAAVVGETPNLAARLQAIAEPDQLVVPSDALPLLGNAFDVTSLGAQDLKGVGRSVEAFVVERETVAESRFAARRPGSLAPIVGREREVNKIADCWALARAGHGQMVVVNGEAGIGKSRIVKAAIDGVAGDDHLRLTFQCSPYHTESAFYPFVRQLSYAAGFAADDTTDQRLTKMEATVGGDPKTQALMALLLGIDGTARYGEISTTPAQQRSLMMQAFVKLLVAKADDKPLFLIFEDLHWIDPTSLELLETLKGALADQQIMILATTRPSFRHDFGTHQTVTHLTLNRLDRDMTYAIVAKLTRGKTLPDEIMQIIARQTDGVPLFVEELTKTILESGALKDQGDGYLMQGHVSDIAIPATLHDSLLARLDRLDSTREIAQIAACVGREFDHRLITKICAMPEARLAGELDKLIAAELIRRKGTPPQARYLFKHALVRDAAYDSLLKERRKTFHRRILDALETEPDAAPELLATHAEAADLTDRAIELWEAAGTAAISRPAFMEGEAHLRRAIALNAPLLASGSKVALTKAVALHVQLCVALMPAKGLWSDEVFATLEQALELADKIGKTPLRGDIIYGLLLGGYFRGNLELSVARAEELRQIASESGDTAQLLVAQRIAANARLNQGRFTDAQPYLDEAERLCKEVAHQDLTTRYGHDPTVAVKIYQSLNYTFRGQTKRAEHYRLEADERARKISHINTTCTMLGLSLVIAHLRDDLVAERQYLRTLKSLNDEYGVNASRLGEQAISNLLKMADGDPMALDAYRETDKVMIDANMRLLVPGHRVVAARRALGLGLIDEAHEMADAAEALMDETGENSWRADLHRLRATFALRHDRRGVAEKHLKTAMDISNQTGAGLWELRAAIDLAHLYRNSGRLEDSVKTLTPVFNKVRKGDCPIEMDKARSLMLDLSLTM